MSKVTAEETKKLLDSGVKSLMFSNYRNWMKYNRKYTDLERVKTIGETLKTNTIHMG